MRDIVKRTDLEPMPWHRIEGESSLQYEAFTIYLELGYKRNLTVANEIYVKKRVEFINSLGYDPESGDSAEPLADSPKKSASIIRVAKKIKEGKYKGFPSNWPKDFMWRERASAYDKHMSDVRQKAVERWVRRNERKRQKMRLKADERAVVVADALIYRALTYFNSVKDIDLRPSDGLAMLRLASEINDRVLGPPAATLDTPIEYVMNGIGSNGSQSRDDGQRPIAMVEIRVPSRNIDDEKREIIDVTPVE